MRQQVCVGTRDVIATGLPLELATYCFAGLMCGRKFRSTESSGLDYGSFALGAILRHNGVDFGVGQSCLGVSKRPTSV